jgi:hypothetical protein
MKQMPRPFRSLRPLQFYLFLDVVLFAGCGAERLQGKHPLVAPESGKMR